MPLVDSHGRTINYMRLSVTDRCNLRCRYCMPPEGVKSLSHHSLLSYDQLLRISHAAVAVGVEKIRVTGGEPLVRKGITGFLERLAQLSGLQHLVLTTNGIMLASMASELRSAGVESLNISLDSLEPATFSEITRGGNLKDVLDGIEAAGKAGFPFVKINVVVMRGVNDHEISRFADMTLDRPYRIRFIEYMPTLQDGGWQARVLPGAQLLEQLSRNYSLEPVAREKLAGPALEFRIRGASGTVGIITPVSGHFCGDCNRIRVTSTGMVRNCLFATEMTDLKPFLNRHDQDALCQALRRAVTSKPQQHQLLNMNCHTPAFAMAQVGG